MAPTTEQKFKGYVTTMSAVTGGATQKLEQRLGFNSGSLTKGYCLYALAAPVTMDEFEWKDRTSYSDGWHYDSTINEYVQRQDELRAHLGKRHRYNEGATDRAIADIMASHLIKLNVRSGPERIVKLVPNSHVSEYPDSPYRNVSQWRLKVPKSFVLLADVPSDAPTNSIGRKRT